MARRNGPDTARDQQVIIFWAPIERTAQEFVFDDLTPEANILFTGGYGSGKTMTLVGKGLQLSHINGDIPGILLVPDYGHFEDTIMEKLTSEDPETGRRWFLEDHQYFYRITRHGTHILEWAGGGDWHIMSAHNPKSIKGPERAWLIGDEPNAVDWNSWRNAVNRIRHPRARLRQKVGFGTPEGLNQLAAQFTEEREGNGSYFRIYNMRTADNRELLKWQPDYMRQVAENSTEQELQSYLEGGIVNLTGTLAYHTFQRQTHWRTDVPDAWENPHLPLRITFDFNVDPMSCVIGQIVAGERGRELNIVDAFIVNSSWTPQICELVANEYGRAACARRGLGNNGWPGGIIIYGDATGGSRSTVSLKSNYAFIKELLGAECDAFKLHETVEKRQNPPETLRINSMRAIFKNANGRVRCYIRKTLPARLCRTMRLVSSLEQTQIPPGHITIHKPAGETHTHASDALGYLVTAEFPAMLPDTFSRKSFANIEV